MGRGRKLIVGGLVVFVLSLLGGVGGTVFGIQSSFHSLITNETAGIGAGGGAGLELAIISTALGIAGSLVGIGLVIAGIVKNRKEG